jgi:hypothetical protein
MGKRFLSLIEMTKRVGKNFYAGVLRVSKKILASFIYQFTVFTKSSANVIPANAGIQKLTCW